MASTRISFPYQFKTITEGKLANPIVTLKVETILGPRKVSFLVDSGSDTMVLPLVPYRFWFRFRPNPKNKIILGGIEGKGIAAYPSKITIQIGKDKINARCFFVRSHTIPLLGRLDVWDKVTWIFDNKKERVVFEKL